MRTRLAPLTLLVITCLAGWSTSAAAKPILMPTVTKQIQQQRAAAKQEATPRATNPPSPPCPENGLIYPAPVSPPFGLPYPFGNCGVGQPPAATVPWLGNMAYYGGHVQVHPKQFVVFWGWGAPKAFPGQTCKSEPFTEGTLQATLPCDPDGAGKYMADFVHQMGGTGWAKVSTQYYQTDSSGKNQYISNDKNVLGGIWVDDTNDIRPLANTTPVTRRDRPTRIGTWLLRPCAPRRTSGSPAPI
jgi:hypothetical protein